jgi:hypothetical protein
MKLSLEIIYKRKQSTKQGRLGFNDRQIVLIKREAQALYFNVRQGVKRLKCKHLFLRFGVENIS